MINPLSPTPLYVQLADLLTKRIEGGNLASGQTLPSETQLRQEFGVSRGTVRAAVALLRERGLVVTMPQRGTYVSAQDVTGAGS
ncbi:GntR family transcriptional regulator [Micromonospora sp. NPDC001898]|uniref:GntR family transcriptional regulator n=1 Tax=Micromonospora sp. NPDC001898 TaxID=3364221 RepID=UPI003684467F